MPYDFNDSKSIKRWASDEASRMAALYGDIVRPLVESILHHAALLEFERGMREIKKANPGKFYENNK